MRPLLIGILALAGAAALPRSAEAFCRTTSTPEQCNQWRRSGNATPGACCPFGNPLFWRSACVGYSLQEDASRHVELARASETVALAFSKWTSLQCKTGKGKGSAKRVSIDVRDLGPVACDEVNYTSTGRNQNVIIFRDEGWGTTTPTTRSV